MKWSYFDLSRKTSFKIRFAKIFLSYVIVILIPLSIISFIYLQNSLNKVESQTREQYQNEVKQFSNAVESVLNKVRDTSLQLAMTSEFNSVLADPDSTGNYQYLLVQKDLSNLTAYDEMYHSIYLHINRTGKSITSREGIVSLDSFYDKQIILDSLEQPDKMWHSTRRVNDPKRSSSAPDVITLSVKLPLTNKNTLGYLIFNLNADYFLEVSDYFNKTSGDNLLVLDESGTIIISRDKSLLYNKLEGNKFSLINENEDTGLQRIYLYNKAYYSISVRSAAQNWTFIKLVPTSELSGHLKSEFYSILKVFISLLLFGLVLAILLARSTYLPWKHLNLKMAGSIKEQNLNKNKDIYEEISHAIDQLIFDNQHIQQVINENKPIIRENLLSDIIWNNVPDIKGLKEKMDYVGISFDLPCFLPFLVKVGDVSEVKEYGARNDLIALCKGIVLEAFFSKFVIQGGIPVDEERIAFLLNIEKEVIDNPLKENLVSACKRVNEELSERVDYQVSFSFGVIVSSIPDIYYSILQAKRRQSLRLVTHIEDIIFCTDKEAAAHFPVIIQKKIINGIKLGNFEVTKTAIDELFNSYILKKNYSHSEVQQFIILVVSNVINYFCQEGEDIQLYNTDILGWIYENDNPKDLYAAMCRYFYNFIEKKSEKTQQSNENNYISKVILFIKQNYHNDFSINNMADSIGLNAAYLSRIFKTATGKTIIEYITLYRLDKAKEMMQSSDMSIKEISAAVGYNEVRSFTRFFKKYEGVTPGEYKDSQSK